MTPSPLILQRTGSNQEPFQTLFCFLLLQWFCFAWVFFVLLCLKTKPQTTETNKNPRNCSMQSSCQISKLKSASNANNYYASSVAVRTQEVHSLTLNNSWKAIKRDWKKNSIFSILEILFIRAITWYWSTAKVFKLKKDGKRHHYSLAKSKKENSLNAVS